MSGKILIFGGTSEGRILCEALSQQGRQAVVCTATAYGGNLLEGLPGGLPGIKVHSGRLNADDMEAFIRRGAFSKVVDATHPYAQEVTRNIRAACTAAGVEYLRVLRRESAAGLPAATPVFATPAAASALAMPAVAEPAAGTAPVYTAVALSTAMPAVATPDAITLSAAPSGVASALAAPAITTSDAVVCSIAPPAAASALAMPAAAPSGAALPGIRLVPDTQAAVSYLASTSGRILLTTGSKELEAFCALRDYRKRLFVRVLPDAEVISRCNALGFSGAQIIAMQGPFSRAFNLALLRQLDCRYLVSKDSGSAGGVEDKVGAALEAGAEIVMIARPLEESGYTLAAVLAMLL